ncbi:MAG: 30S ribosomal protein S4 [Thermoplasmata archaeon]
MGDPKFPRAKWSRPSHPWQADRIKAENELIQKFGLKNKRELWKAQSLMRRWRQRARILQAKVRYEDAQAEKEVRQLLQRLARLGPLPPEGATLDDVLALEVENLLGRRLQTLVYLRGLGNTMRHARQLIVHGHISIGDRKVTIPGYLVKKDEEEDIKYHAHSALANEAHPARPSLETLEGRRIATEGGD